MFAEFFPVVVTALPADEDHAPLLVDPAAARVVRGDTVLASFSDVKGRMCVVDYFNDQYNAFPIEYDPHCGVCETLLDTPRPVVNVGRENYWDTCDPWTAANLVLIVPAQCRTLPSLVRSPTGTAPASASGICLKPRQGACAARAADRRHTSRPPDWPPAADLRSSAPSVSAPT